MTLIVPERRTHYPRAPRRFVVHGWAFMDLPERDVEAVKRFLATGEVSVLPRRFQLVAIQYAEETTNDPERDVGTAP